MSVADFCRHQPDANAAGDLEVDEKQLAALQQLEAIRSRRQPQPIEVPTVPLDKIRSTLAYCKDDVDAGLEESVRAAAAVFVNGSGENWLQSGVQVTRNNGCPFCGQDVTKNRMLAAYRHYFSDAYSKIKKDIRECQEAVSSSLSEKVTSQIRIVILSNASTAERWSDHPEIHEELVDPAQLDEVLTTACASLRQVLSAKECHPYDTPTSTMETLFQSAFIASTCLRHSVGH